MSRSTRGAPVALIVALVCVSVAHSRAAPLVDGLGGPLGLGEPQGLGSALDVSEAFPGGLRLYDSGPVDEVWVNVASIISLNQRACCYRGEPLPSTLDIESLLGRIHIWEASTFNVDLEPGQPDWYVYSALEPHLGPDSPGRLIATWHPMPNFFPDDPRTRFVSVQGILTAVGEDGDFDVEMRYHQCGWFDGHRAGNDDLPVIGFDGDQGPDGPGWMWPGSLTPDTQYLCELSNVREPGVFRYQVRGGIPGGCGPDAEAPPGPDRCADGNHMPGDGCSPACYIERDVDGDGRFEAPSPESVDPLGIYDDCFDVGNPLCNDDEDGDGVPGVIDNCDDTPNPDQRDYDGDTLGDACDRDADDDGLDLPVNPDSPNSYLDNCPFLHNQGVRRLNPDVNPTAQTVDTDRDGLGDPCDPDDDDDGVSDCGLDGLCDRGDNGSNEDRDIRIDEAGECDPDDIRFENCNRGDRDLVDNDADGFIDEHSERDFEPVEYPGPDAGEDNCRRVPNPGQSDLDGDGIGDACDADVDGDGVENCDTGICGPEADYRDNDGDGEIDEPGECSRGCPTASDLIDQDLDGFIDEDFEPDAFADAPVRLDVCPDVFDPDQDDRNGDKTGDACADDDDDLVLGFEDNCISIANTDQADLDEDGIGDVCDPDRDGDGLANGDDNCPDVGTMDQTNTDGDRQGDACDEDDDADGLLDAADNCRLVVNRDQIDTDGDGFGDACDADDDGDGINDDAPDLCPLHADPDQADLDGDGIGDVCDDDDDADGVDDGDDLCPRVADPRQADLDGDRMGDACDPDDDDDGTADGEDVCPRLADDQRDTDGDGAGDACDDDDDDDGTIDVDDLCPRVAGAGRADKDGDGIGDGCDPVDDRPFEARSPDEKCAILIERAAPTAERLRHCPPPAESGGCSAASTTGAPALWLLGLLALGMRRRR